MLRLTPIVLLAACTVAPTYTPPLFGDGYRADGDQCRRVAEDDFTNQFLDDAADLVACPLDMENIGVFALDTGASAVAQVPGYILYSVPRR
ncbi:hypothetical protein LGQ03_05590 [Loktanella sp. TSTF-M6]|uniref:Lipoprotein n=1 Tax=Loktanella gaetbuli TaxID=2881335 RepID=A0ABS8BT58_9RHOB|nr:hypothetical protein [Loktanella gaetbuli]MCB5198706.1 hypothetical protein [Loktanella gaetbuli]